MADVLEQEPIDVKHVLKTQQDDLIAGERQQIKAEAQKEELERELDDPRLLGNDRDDVLAELVSVNRYLRRNAPLFLQQITLCRIYKILAGISPDAPIALRTIGNIRQVPGVQAVLADMDPAEAQAAAMHVIDELSRRSMLELRIRGYLSFPQDMFALQHVRDKYAQSPSDDGKP